MTKGAQRFMKNEQSRISPKVKDAIKMELTGKVDGTVQFVGCHEERDELP